MGGPYYETTRRPGQVGAVAPRASIRLRTWGRGQRQGPSQLLQGGGSGELRFPSPLSHPESRRSPVCVPGAAGRMLPGASATPRGPLFQGAPGPAGSGFSEQEDLGQPSLGQGVVKGEGCERSGAGPQHVLGRGESSDQLRACPPLQGWGTGCGPLRTLGQLIAVGL